MKDKIRKRLEDSYAKSKDLEYKAEDWHTEEWESIKVCMLSCSHSAWCSHNPNKGMAEKLFVLYRKEWSSP